MSKCKKFVNVVNVGARTINLAKEPLHKKRDCPETGFAPPSPPASHIRVCTPEQLRSICPPPPCYCPEPPPPLTPLEKLGKALFFVTKVMILLGVIKWTDDLGIWGNGESTAGLARDGYKRMQPVLGSKDQTSGQYYGLTYNLGTMWNNFVTAVFYGIGVLPQKGSKAVFDLVNTKKPEENTNK